MFPQLLDLLPSDIAPPEGCPTEPLILGWRAVAPDLRSSHGHRDPWPGGWCVPLADGRNWSADHPHVECPSSDVGGYCVAKNWDGARSGGHPAITVLLVGYRASDVLGHSTEKVRVAARYTLAVLDLPRLIREGWFVGASLRGASLRGASLRGADLYGADLRDADLRDADLCGTNLRDASLRDADLYGADLRGADLRGADLRGTNLRDAYLRDADLRGADLRGTNLRGTNLRGADLRGTNLRDAYLRDAYLRDADLRGATAAGAIR